MRTALSLILSLVVTGSAAWSQEPVRNPPPDVAGLQGWSGPESLKLTAEWTAQQPAFQLVHPRTGEPVWQDNERARVCLWETQNGGKLPPTVRQLIGDCTSHGAAHSVERMQTDGFKPICSEFIYGASRVNIAKGAFGPGDGCSGAATARACRDIGVVPRDTPGVGPYDGRRAKEWGAKGPPAHLLEVAAKHRVRTVALMTSAADVRDAIANRHPCTCASMFGTNNADMVVRDGRIVAPWSGRWSHQMCVDGYDGSAASGERYFHLTNSWGPDAHPAPIDGSPAGGFWVTWATMERMVVTAKDTWAYSQFDGFPAELDLSPLRPKRRTSGLTVPVRLIAPRRREDVPSYPTKGFVL